MIARVWTARTTPANSAAYREHLEQRVLPALRAIEGYAGATMQSRTDGEGVEVVVTTRWSSLEAVRRFAGDDFERAVVAEEAAALLTAWDRRVRHYEIVLNDEPGRI
ncbi:MAG TPA: antibiotic biosynthesis monooxygenase [Thermoanaerobaculia bacterium]|nr:antibiotic biosynthesis monooxygenase [Thermoanaerobaculia bacterium]